MMLVRHDPCDAELASPFFNVVRKDDAAVWKPSPGADPIAVDVESMLKINNKKKARPVYLSVAGNQNHVGGRTCAHILVCSTFRPLVGRR
jgi:hypothetical protein